MANLRLPLSANIFTNNSTPELYTMYDHILRNYDVSTIQPYFYSGLLINSESYINNVKTIYIWKTTHWFLSAGTANRQMMLSFQDDNGDLHSLYSKSVPSGFFAMQNYETYMRIDNYNCRYFTAFTIFIDNCILVGYEITIN